MIFTLGEIIALIATSSDWYQSMMQLHMAAGAAIAGIFVERVSLSSIYS